MTTNVTNDPNISWDSKDHTLNAYVELVYIRFGNQMITVQLSQLQAALSSTDNAVNTLKDITAMRNYAVVQLPQLTFEDFAKDFNPDTGQYQQGYGQGFTYDKKYDNPDAYEKAFNQVTDAYDKYKKDNLFNQFGYNGVAWTANSPDFQSWANSMMVYKQNLETVLTSLDGQMTNDQKADPNGMYAKLQAVYDSMPNSAADFEGWKAWAMDGYGINGQSATGGGKISQLLDSATNATTSFMNTTTETLQRFLNIMEQYYKSANEILKTTTDNIKTYARGIAGR